MKNYVQPGCNVTVTAPANTPSGQGVLIGQLFGVAAETVETGDDLDITTEGVFDLAADLTDTWIVGAPVYFSSTRKLCQASTDDDSSNSIDSNSGGDAAAMIGVAVAAKGAGAATVRVKLAPSPVTLV